MTSPVRIAVVGLGYWGPNLIRNINEHPGAEAVLACDLRTDVLESIARRYPAVETTTSFADVLADPRVEAVVIATPVSKHHPMAAAALDAGKHVFVEKPLAASAEESLDLIERAGAAGRVLMPGHTFLYSPPVMLVKQMIESGELGDIYFISTSRVNLGLHQSDVSASPGTSGRTTSRSCATGSTRARRTRARWPVAACSRTSRTSRSSTSSSRPAPSPTSSCRGSRRASCAARRSSARARWSSTTTRAPSPSASSTPARSCRTRRRSASTS